MGRAVLLTMNTADKVISLCIPIASSSTDDLGQANIAGIGTLIYFSANHTQLTGIAWTLLNTRTVVVSGGTTINPRIPMVKQ